MRMGMTFGLPLLAGLLGACTPAESASPSCIELRPALESCPGFDVESLMTACEADEEGRALTAELAHQACPVEPGKADGLGESSFKAACVAGMLSASLVLRARNPLSVPLSAKVKSAFRPFYGDLVDQVRIHYGTRLIDDLAFHESQYDGQTFGNHIYVKEPCSGDDALEVLAHEMMHAKQAHDLRSVTAFANAYCAGFWTSDFSYSDNPLEVDAMSYGDEYVYPLTWSTPACN